MSNETKYTNDGKKVLVVGKLNNQETIVQEIFVGQGGQEIPSGENFVVKSLHDSPVESWKEKNLRELEAKYETERRYFENRILTQSKRLADAEQKAKLKADALINFDKNADSSQLERLKSFMAGEITHFFIVDSYCPKIVTWDDELYSEEGYSNKIESIRLVSLYGKSNGDLEYKINRYSDGSGSMKEIQPCNSYEEALGHAQKLFDERCEKYLSDDKTHLNLETWMKIEGLIVPKEVVDKHNAAKEKNRAKMIADLEDKINKLKEQ